MTLGPGDDRPKRRLDVELHLDEALARKVLAPKHESGVTLDAVLKVLQVMAAAVVLGGGFYYCGEDEQIVGCPIALGAPMTTASRSRSSAREIRTCSRRSGSRVPRR